MGVAEPDARREPAPPDVDEAEEVLLDLGDDGADELEQGAAGWQRPAPPPLPPADPQQAQRGQWDARLTAVAAEEGWDEADVAAVRAYLAQVPYPLAPDASEVAIPSPMPAAPQDAESHPVTASDLPGADFALPGSAELDDALSALAVSPPPTAELPPTPAMERASESAPATPSTDRAWAKAEPPNEPSDEASDEPAPSWPARDTTVVSRPGSVAGFGDRTLGPDDPMAEPEWLRGRRDAAARAYRRLRRIFPTNER